MHEIGEILSRLTERHEGRWWLAGLEVPTKKAGQHEVR